MTCRHAFHKTCVDKWLETGRNNCPACRSKVTFAFHPLDIHSYLSLRVFPLIRRFRKQRHNVYHHYSFLHNSSHHTCVHCYSSLPLFILMCFPIVGSVISAVASALFLFPLACLSTSCLFFLFTLYSSNPKVT